MHANLRLRDRVATRDGRRVTSRVCATSERAHIGASRGVGVVIQASAAIAIVALTSWLARTATRTQFAADAARQQATQQAKVAQDALGVAQHQADLAEEADRHARRDRQLLEVPRIDVKRATHGIGSSMGFDRPDMILIVYFLNSPIGRHSS